MFIGFQIAVQLFPIDLERIHEVLFDVQRIPNDCQMIAALFFGCQRTPIGFQSTPLFFFELRNWFSNLFLICFSNVF